MSEEKRNRNLEIYELATLKRRSTGDLSEQFDLSPPRISQIIHHVGRQKYGEHLTIEELRTRESRPVECPECGGGHPAAHCDNMG